jgi:hypothetical protein
MATALVVFVACVVGVCSMPRGPGMPPWQETSNRILAPAIGGLAMEADALADIADGPVEQVAFLSESGVAIHDVHNAAAALLAGPEQQALPVVQPDEPPGTPPSPSSSSSSSSEDHGSSGPDKDDAPAEGRSDVGFRRAGREDQRTTYFWTFSYTASPNRKRPDDFSRESFAAAVVGAYESTGKSVSQWACFREKHPGSSSELEQRHHFHLVVEADKPCRWAQIAETLRAKGIYASVSTVSVRRSYWRAFQYCFPPSVKQAQGGLDVDYVLSPGHEDVPCPMRQKRDGVRRLSPNDVFEVIVAHGLDTPLKFFAFAARQHAAGDKSWVQLCMTKGEAKIKQTVATAALLQGAGAQLARKAMSHMDVLRAGLERPCVCEGRAVAGLEHILVHNGIDVLRYRRSVLALFKGGGGKGLNHLYVGVPSSGKTALTKPLLALFDTGAFVKPQVGTSFALQGMIGAEAVIWNDFRWPHPPLAWPD